jgi:serine/threonine-protein kinase
LFDRLLDLPDVERDAAIDRLADAPALRRRLQRLLALHRNPGFLDHAPPSSNAPPNHVGDWKIVEEIGRGGMAVVYRAERQVGESIQVAALKLLTAGALAGNGRERFLREQSILIRLDHPHIVGLLDAGVLDDGTPWLAMALVHGERIDAWCGRLSLDTRAIVSLFLDVCSAVAYAHRNLVVHRDLKPSNILVDRDAGVRLLDFGIARLIEDGDCEATATALRALTPRYAAPEQFGSDPTTTVTDVFGLGAVLYALLAGRPPRDSASNPDETISWPSRAVRDNDQWPLAQRRSRARELQGDLDTILLKALAAEPNRRFPTVEAFAGDLRAWLGHRPIAARPASLWYLASRFVRRNRFAAAIAMLALLLSAISGWQVISERDRAEAQASRATEVRDFLANVFASAEPSRGPVPSLVDILDEGSRRSREELLGPDPLAAADVLTITGATYRELGELDKAEIDLREALAILLRVQPPPAIELANVYSTLGRLNRVRGQTPESIEALSKGLAWAKRAGAPAEQIFQIEVSIAASENYAGRAEHAEESMRRVIDEISEEQLDDTQVKLDALNALGTSLAIQRRNYPEQAALHERRLMLTASLYGEDSGWYAFALADAVPTFRKANQVSRAEELARESVKISDRIYSSPHMIAAVANCNLGGVLQQQGRISEALDYYDRSISIDDAMSRGDLHAESCRRSRAIARAAVVDFSGSRDDVAADRDILEKLDKVQSPLWLSTCGIETSILVRERRYDEASTLLDRCATEHSPTPPTPVDEFDLARAEIEMARADWQAAGTRLADLRTRLPTSATSRAWLRPWMLSVFVAGALDDASSRARLVAEILAVEPVPGMQDLSIASPCLKADASLAACMVLP